MYRRAILLNGLMLIAACGRIDFEERSGGDASSSGDGGPGDAAGVMTWSHLVAYANQTCGVIHGDAYCWGANNGGQLGDGTTTDRAVPTKVLGLATGTIQQLAVGEVQGLAITGATLFGWGSLGTPAPAAIGLAAPPTSVSAGRDFQCVVATDTYCWGASNSAGQLGTGNTTVYTTPTKISYAGAPIVSVEGGDDHACALDATGLAYCWGHNDYGTLGNNMAALNSSSTPVAVAAPVATLPQISGWHACSLDAGTVYCWGEGDNGENGDGANASYAGPHLVPALTGVTRVTTGGGPTDRDATCAISNGSVTCWGNGLYGRLGQGVAANASTPTAVVGLPGPAVDVVIGYDHACALLQNGDLYCWGRGDRGQLGNGQLSSSLAPVKVLSP